MTCARRPVRCHAGSLSSVSCVDPLYSFGKLGPSLLRKLCRMQVQIAARFQGAFISALSLVLVLSGCTCDM